MGRLDYQSLARMMQQQLHDEDEFEAHDKGSDAVNAMFEKKAKIQNYVFLTLGCAGRQITIFGRGPKQTKPLAGKVRWSKWCSRADKTKKQTWANA